MFKRWLFAFLYVLTLTLVHFLSEILIPLFLKSFILSSIVGRFHKISRAKNAAFVGLFSFNCSFDLAK